MKFSIIIPTFNEQKDISLTLDYLINLKHLDKEIIVVDDSTDNTPCIVSNYFDKGVKLIRVDNKHGRCGARNIGILQSEGDVVVILNADVHLPPNFLQDISVHYSNGYDYVLVRSVVENIEFLFARYVECRGILDHYLHDPQWMEWTEGFSCKRDLAIRAGLFPVGYSLPISAGEDGIFGKALNNIGAKKKIDFNITVTHVSPFTFKEYWHTRVGRGEGSAHIKYFIEKKSIPIIYILILMRIIKNLFFIFSILPMFFISIRVSLNSEKKLLDLIPFIFAWIIETIAFSCGEIKVIHKLIKIPIQIRNASHLSG